MLKKFSVIFVIFLISIIFIIDKKQDKFLIMKANSCLRKNDIKCTQKNLEKAFSMGIKDETSRITYVNSIINSPFDLKAQDKALNFLAYNINDAAQEKINKFIDDIKQEIDEKYSDNYIQQTVYNQKILHWGKLPITYEILNEEIVPKYFKEEIEKAFTQWEIATKHQILFERKENDPDIIIEFVDLNPINNKNKKFIVAYTTPTIISDHLENMEIEFYIKDPNGDLLTKNQVYNTALHEISHALGVMGHSQNQKDVMYMTKDSMTTTQDLRDNLTNADINTVKLLYKIKPDITNSKNLLYEYIPNIILGDENKIINAKREEAKDYIKKAPHIATGYIDLAGSYVETKNYSKAIKLLEHALKIDNSEEINALIYYNLAVSYYYINNLNIAEEYIQKSLQIEESEEKIFLLAKIHKQQGNLTSAEKEYKYLINLSPENSEYVIALTNLYINNKNYLKARKVLKEYFKHNPEYKNNPKLKPYGILKAF